MIPLMMSYLIFRALSHPFHLPVDLLPLSSNNKRGSHNLEIHLFYIYLWLLLYLEVYTQKIMFN